LLDGAAKLAEQQGALIQSHLAETEIECDLVRTTFDGRRYVEVYRDWNLLTPRSYFGHGIYLNQQDRAMIALAGARIVHCPTANSFLRSGTMNRHELLADGIELALGSDIGAGYERSMVRVARAMIESAASIGAHFPSAAEAWYAITAGNADSLGWSDAGRLNVGAAADLVVIEPDIPWLDGRHDPLARLMFSWDDRWLRRTMLRGRFAEGVSI
jgi:guanine deaminase